MFSDASQIDVGAVHKFTKFVVLMVFHVGLKPIDVLCEDAEIFGWRFLKGIADKIVVKQVATAISSQFALA